MTFLLVAWGKVGLAWRRIGRRGAALLGYSIKSIDTFVSVLSEVLRKMECGCSRLVLSSTASPRLFLFLFVQCAKMTFPCNRLYWKSGIDFSCGMKC